MLKIEEGSCGEPEIMELYHENSLNKVFASAMFQIDSLKDLLSFVPDSLGEMEGAEHYFCLCKDLLNGHYAR